MAEEEEEDEAALSTASFSLRLSFSCVLLPSALRDAFSQDCCGWCFSATEEEFAAPAELFILCCFSACCFSIEEEEEEGERSGESGKEVEEEERHGDLGESCELQAEEEAFVLLLLPAPAFQVLLEVTFASLGDS